jgi:hypothetical protein
MFGLFVLFDFLLDQFFLSLNLEFLVKKVVYMR